MKIKLLFLALICNLCLVKAQNINIPNFDFATNLNGWTLTGNNVSMSNSNGNFPMWFIFLQVETTQGISTKKIVKQ
ncbi:hypothetical protein [Xanthomarina sp. F2636L]|uniref:hypothetical protein n=1 Tax=Xanthomarina sp. F2636L TaxID=2996018 RepID=UPI00225DCFF2|nr:hypothetical protein [Xanthomarina sp. F2636L]MCX7549869.1 hypothetical protein [Xanthomarina sp. F2636L]